LVSLRNYGKRMNKINWWNVGYIFMFLGMVYVVGHILVALLTKDVATLDVADVNVVFEEADAISIGQAVDSGGLTTPIGGSPYGVYAPE